MEVNEKLFNRDGLNSDEYRFKALVVSEIYYNDDSRWGVYTFSSEEDIPHLVSQEQSFFDKKIMLHTSKIVGIMQRLQIGAEYYIQAQAEYNKKYNTYQYKAEKIKAIVPSSLENKQRLLYSITSKSIADELLKVEPNIINKIISGEVTETNFDTKPVKGLGTVSWKNLYNKIINNYATGELIAELEEYGISALATNSMLKKYASPELLKEDLFKNPYMLCDFKGFGFLRADDIALKINAKLLNSRKRMKAFVNYYLTNIGEDGHTWCYGKDLYKAAKETVPQAIEHFKDVIQDRNFHIKQIENDFQIGLDYLFKKERFLFSVLEDKQNHFKTPVKLIPTCDEIDKAIKESEQEQGFCYTKEQREIVESALQENVAIISGVAGSGKSTISRGILAAYKNKGLIISCVAMSAKAAQRIKETTGLEAATIHRTLMVNKNKKIKYRFVYNETNRLPSDIVFVDESSMINCSLFYDLVSAMKDDSKLILVGDALQLPPIGAGNVFADMLVNNKFKSYKLTKPLRQASDSGILVDANKIRAGKNPLEKPDNIIVHGEKKDMAYMFRRNREELNRLAIKNYKHAVEEYGIDNVIVISPRRQGCTNSTYEINKQIQKLLQDRNKAHIKLGNKNNSDLFFVDDRVIQTKNDYDNNVFNGEIGIVTDAFVGNEGNKPINHVVVQFADGNEVMYRGDSEIRNLDLAYALTVHKDQGSEQAVVIGIVDNTHYALLDSCLLYTMITRAKKKFLLLAEPQAYLRCIRQNNTIHRQTWLKGFGQRRN